MPTYFTGKGYGVSDLTDLSGRPLLTYQGPNDDKPILCSDRCAVTFDPTIAQVISVSDLHTPRMDTSIEQRMRDVTGCGPDDELDHKIPLELGGSNLPVNLMVQPGRVGGVSAASDTIETTLANRVAAGQVSLQTAWAAIALDKNFYLVEQAPAGASFSFGSVLSQVIGMVGQVSLTSVSGKKGTIASETQAQIDQNMALLKQNPFNQKTRLALFNAQILATQQKTGLSANDAAIAVRTLLESYGATSGMSRADVHNTLSVLEQRLLQVSKTPPTILGIESRILVQGLMTAAGVGGLALIAGAIIILVGVILAGPEEVAAAGIGFSLSSISTAFGLNVVLGTGVAVVEIAGMVAGFSFLFGMSIKLYYDNVVLAPTQMVTAFKDLIGIEKTIGGGFQMAAATGGALGGTPSPYTTGASVSSGGGGTTSIQVFTGVIANGTLGSPAQFTERPSDLITTQAQLLDAAKNNLSSYLVSLPGLIYYELAVVPSITTRGGFRQKGQAQRVIVGYHKKKSGGGFVDGPNGLTYVEPTYVQGLPIYKTIYNKFAVINVGITDMSGKMIKLGQIVLGPTDASAFNPTITELKNVSTAITPQLVTTNVQAIKAIQTTTPVTVTTPVPTAPAAVQTPPPASVTVTPAPTQVVQQPAATIPVTPAPAATLAPVSMGTFNPRGIYNSWADLATALKVTTDALTAANPALSAAVFRSNSRGSTDLGWLATLTANGPAGGYVPFVIPSSSPYAGSAQTPKNAAAMAAQTLSDFYTAISSSLPPIATRAQIYEKAGLGSAALYTGTAEQNTKLLNYLKTTI